MKKNVVPFLFLLTLFSCGSKSSAPDVKNIEVSIPVTRFDTDFFRIDTSQIFEGLQSLQQKHPEFYPDFMQEILGIEQSITPQTIEVTRQFLIGYKPIYDSLQRVFNKTEWLQDDLETAFKYVKYYFPAYKTGKAILFVGPFDAPGIASTNAGLAIGLQQYAGSNFSIYQTGPIQSLFPAFISRRFSPEYITSNAMKSVVQEVYPGSTANTLVEQMIERGKEWYLIDKFLPATPDSLKTGYTQQQLEWCEENEGLIWSYIIRNEDLHSLSPAVIQTYLRESPFTQGFSQELSPGNIGQWLGWRIIQKYEFKHPGIHPAEVMKADAKKILEEAKYKPK